MGVEVAQMDAVGRLGVAIKRIDILKQALREIADAEPGSQGAYAKFVRAKDVATSALQEIARQERG